MMLRENYLTVKKLKKSVKFLKGIVAEHPDLVILDIDLKGENLGRDPWEIVESFGLPPTYTQSTPSGGLHLFYSGGGVPFGQRDFAPNINVRATNGYAVGAGSEVDGVRYAIARRVVRSGYGRYQRRPSVAQAKEGQRGEVRAS